MISNNLKNCLFIILLKNSKIPLVEKGEDWNNKIISYEEANKKLEEGYNIGIVAGNGIILIDIDNEEIINSVEAILPNTYKEASISGGFHYIYKYKKAENRLLESEQIHYGEIRANRQYIVIAPSIAFNKLEPPELKSYKIIDDLEIAEIKEADYNTFTSLFDINITKNKIPEETLKIIEEDNGLKKLFYGDITGYDSRSEAELSLVNRLVARGFTKEQIFKIMTNSKTEKWANASIQYRNLTYNKACSMITTEKSGWKDGKFNPEILETLKPVEIKDLFISDRELENKQESEIEWLVDKWIPCGDICFIAGKAGSFKTTTALHIIYSVSEGKFVFNKYKTKKSKILYLNEENHTKLFRNIIKRVKNGLELKDNKSDDIYFSLMKNLKIDSNLKDIIDFVKKNKIEVIVFDSFRRFFIGEENDAGVINYIFDIFKMIRTECNDATIIVLHHAKKDTPGITIDIRDILRGSSDIVNSADSVIGIKRKHGNNAIIIEHIKNRAGEELVGKLIKIDSGENKDKAYFYETDVETNKDSLISIVDTCANKILKLIEDKKLSVLMKTDLFGLEAEFSPRNITKALSILCNEGTLTLASSGRYTKYLVNINTIDKNTQQTL